MPLLPEEKYLSNDFNRILLISFLKMSFYFLQVKVKIFPLYMPPKIFVSVFSTCVYTFFSTDNDPIAHGKCVLFGHGLN